MRVSRIFEVLKTFYELSNKSSVTEGFSLYFYNNFKYLSPFVNTGDGGCTCVQGRGLAVAPSKVLRSSLRGVHLCYQNTYASEPSERFACREYDTSTGGYPLHAPSDGADKCEGDVALCVCVIEYFTS